MSIHMKYLSHKNNKRKPNAQLGTTLTLMWMTMMVMVKMTMVVMVKMTMVVMVKMTMMVMVQMTMVVMVKMGRKNAQLHAEFNLDL